jgi:hypothetical protein
MAFYSRSPKKVSNASKQGLKYFGADFKDVNLPSNAPKKICLKPFNFFSVHLVTKVCGDNFEISAKLRIFLYKNWLLCSKMPPSPLI